MNNADYLIRASRGQAIEFTSCVDDWEGYPEEGMRAIIVGFEWDDPELGKLFLDFEPFDAHNKELEKHNYYDKNGVACLTAREAGYYKPQDYYYTVPSNDLGRMYNFVDEEQAARSINLRSLWEQKYKDKATYVSWIENLAYEHIKNGGLYGKLE